MHAAVADENGNGDEDEGGAAAAEGKVKERVSYKAVIGMSYLPPPSVRVHHPPRTVMMSRVVVGYYSMHMGYLVECVVMYVVHVQMKNRYQIIEEFCHIRPTSRYQL